MKTFSTSTTKSLAIGRDIQPHAGNMNPIRTIANFAAVTPSNWARSISLISLIFLIFLMPLLPFPLAIILETIPGGSGCSGLAYALRDPLQPSSTSLRASHGKQPLRYTFEIVALCPF